MTSSFRRIAPSCAALLLGGALAACASQQQVATPAAPAGPVVASSGHTMMGERMRDMDMKEMMAHCVMMRQQMQQGARMSPADQGMMSHCAQMDRTMSPTAPR